MQTEATISAAKLREHRARTFCYLPRKRLRSKQDAIDFVNERGTVFFWPIKGIDFPSLWGAVAGDRPVPNNHDDPAHVTWGWKDDLLGKKVWFYAKILRQKSTIISLDLLPYFYALSPNYGNPEEDYLISYEEGVLSSEEKLVYEALLNNGALDSLMLRKAANLSSSENTSRFNRALLLLQRDFRILPVGIAESGAWHYAFIFDAVHRQFPDLTDRAHDISEAQARQEILRSYFLSVGSATKNDVKKLFQWIDLSIDRSLKTLVGNGFLIEGVQIEDKPGDWFTIKELLD
ncbi:MAG: hypothetical protein Q8N39_01305 [Pelolinea sp.]|nr:hypothetical protein [Pelolinea sp.]